MAVYLASKIELPTIKYVDGETVFCVTPDNREVLNEHLTLPYKYHCGSYGGCGCGFCYDFRDPKEKPDECDELARRSVEDFFGYLREHLRKTDYFEIYSCWVDEEELEALERQEINLAHFDLGTVFWFQQREYLKIFDDPNAEPGGRVLYDT